MRNGYAALAIFALLAVALPAHADAVPFGDTAVAFDADAQVLRVARAGLSDQRGKVAGQVVRAREVALRRAREALHAHVDRALSASGASAAVAERVHDALHNACEVTGERQLSDGSVVVGMQVPASVLVGAWPEGRAHWLH